MDFRPFVLTWYHVVCNVLTWYGMEFTGYYMVFLQMNISREINDYLVYKERLGE